MEKKTENKWTQFMDMHSGGGNKEGGYEYIYIEAPEEEARIIFYNRFGHSSDRVSCTCCGEDYSVSESDSLEQATAYNRGCKYDNSKKKYVEEPQYGDSGILSLSEYLLQNDVLVIHKKDIKDSERIGDVPEQGYVWR